MKLILLSGGSGKRLWPLSNESRSKQFLKLLKNKEGQPESMVQRVWEQLQSNSLKDKTYITTSKTQVDIIQNQLGTDIPLIIEPHKRDTFPAIALSCLYLYSKEKMPLNEIICVLPVDAYVENEYFEKINQLDSIVEQSNSNLVLLGATPTYPSEKYGYILPDKKGKNKKKQPNYLPVRKFIEKPNEATAKKLIEDGALWNCGVFAFKLSYIISIIKENGWPANYDQFYELYGQLPTRSFDYEVVEKESQVTVVHYNGNWKDLGTWNTLTEEMNSSLLGRGIVSDDSLNTHVINELNIPVIAQGLTNLVIACSSDGILVSDKSASSKIKDLIAHFQDRPMFEERRWGYYSVLDYTEYESGDKVLTKKIIVKPGKNLSYQYHNHRMEVWTIIKGEGKFVLDNQIFDVQPGDVLEIPIGSKHGIKAVTELEVIEVQLGKKLVEEDITRLFMTWEELEDNLQ
ncbi:sugar phosphate nucleotidyltransferase [Bacillus dakarensis]|uniref:sugar phosphate nucleotidyltransferase n=1 Tax=Robertmurraya dakarensis TaxID=1926278 RepID=UPI000981B9A3|nr:sugar phosphate nucleotidyltransferase [Bacillus dakarensis]